MNSDESDQIVPSLSLIKALAILIHMFIEHRISRQLNGHLDFVVTWLKFSNITKTRLFKYFENFTTKNWNFSDKKSDIFHISAQNIDCGYSLEPPRRRGSNKYPQSMFSEQK